MARKILFRSWGLMDLFEQNQFKKEVEEDGYYTSDSEEGLERYCQEVNDDYLYDEIDNLSYGLKDVEEFEIQGFLGFWNGKHKIVPVRVKTIKEAIFKCLEDSNIIFEDQYGNLCISAYHHNGQNLFKIKKVVNDKARCLHVMKEVYGII